MKTVNQHIRDHLLSSRGILSKRAEKAPTPEQILKSEWPIDAEIAMRDKLNPWLFKQSSRLAKFNKFIALGKNRIVMGYLRYGSIHNNTNKYNRIDSVISRLERYKREGNSEDLVDAMNLCGMEFISESHPNFHWSATDDGEHVGVTHGTP